MTAQIRVQDLDNLDPSLINGEGFMTETREHELPKLGKEFYAIAASTDPVDLAKVFAVPDFAVQRLKWLVLLH